jgi:hypothetical protein
VKNVIEILIGIALNVKMLLGVWAYNLVTRKTNKIVFRKMGPSCVVER